MRHDSDRGFSVLLDHVWKHPKGAWSAFSERCERRFLLVVHEEVSSIFATRTSKFDVLVSLQNWISTLVQSSSGLIAYLNDQDKMEKAKLLREERRREREEREVSASSLQLQFHKLVKPSNIYVSHGFASYKHSFRVHIYMVWGVVFLWIGRPCGYKLMIVDSMFPCELRMAVLDYLVHSIIWKSCAQVMRMVREVHNAVSCSVHHAKEWTGCVRDLCLGERVPLLSSLLVLITPTDVKCANGVFLRNWETVAPPV